MSGRQKEIPCAVFPMPSIQTQRSLRQMRPTMKELASVVADAFPRQTWAQRWELAALVARMAWVRLKIEVFLLHYQRG